MILSSFCGSRWDVSVFEFAQIPAEWETFYCPLVKLTMPRELLPSVEHRQHCYLNNRAENSHQPTRQLGPTGRFRRRHSCSSLGVYLRTQRLIAE